MADEGLIITPIPSLVATLLNKERAKGSPLSEAEVLRIRDECPAQAMTAEQHKKVVEGRGYDDINPENAWVDWQEARKMFDDLEHA